MLRFAALAGPPTSAGRIACWCKATDKLAIVAADGRIEWEMPWGGIHDVHVLPNGHIMVQQGAATVVEIDPDDQKSRVVVRLGNANGNDGKPVEVHAFQPLADGRVMIAEAGPARIIEIDRDGKIAQRDHAQVDHPAPAPRHAAGPQAGHAATTWSATKATASCASTTASGEVVWEYRVPLFAQARRRPRPEAFGNQRFAAVRLDERQHADHHRQRPQRARSDARRRRSSGSSSRTTCRASRSPGSRRSKCCRTATTSSATATRARRTRR